MNCRKCKDTGKVLHYSLVQPFNPNSTKQVAALIRLFGLKVPRKHGEDKDTTEAKYLKRFLASTRKRGESKDQAERRSQAFRWILECRERQKLISTYIWPLTEQGYFYTTYTFNPSTWRKASQNPNTQNIPKRSDLARQFRKMLVAKPGMVLVAGDSSAIEAVLVGYDAGSEQLIRIAKAGIHGWLAARLLGQPIDPDLPLEELVPALKAVKEQHPVLYDTCKRVVYLSTYAGTPQRIFEEYPEHFTSVAEARGLQNAYFDTGPGKDVLRWQRKKMELAHKHKCLDNHFGMRHHFYDVFTYDSRSGRWKFGTDAKRAVAFIPQADASAVQNLVLQTLAGTWLGEWKEDEHGRPATKYLRRIIHDEIICEVPEKHWQEAASVLYRALTQPWPQLNGLDIGAEISVGKNLASWSGENLGGMRVVEAEL